MRFGIGWAHIREPRLFAGRQFDSDLVNNRPRQFALHREHIPNISFVSLAPDALFAVGLHQLHVDPNTFAGTEHGTLHDPVHIQLTRDL